MNYHALYEITRQSHHQAVRFTKLMRLAAKTPQKFKPHSDIARHAEQTIYKMANGIF